MIIDYYCCYYYNLSNADTEGTEQSVHIREVSVLERSRRLRHFQDCTDSLRCSVTKFRLKVSVALISESKSINFIVLLVYMQSYIGI